MASNFFPMLSSSPPPLDDADALENYDEDDFGNFASAHPAFGNISLDSPDSSVPAKIASNGNKCQKTNHIYNAENSVNKAGSVHSNICINDYDDFGDFASSGNNERLECNARQQNAEKFCKQNRASYAVNSQNSEENSPTIALACSTDISSIVKNLPEDFESRAAEVSVNHVYRTVAFEDEVERYSLDDEDSDYDKRSVNKRLSPKLEQQDNTSQDSVPDSGVCNSSHHSETSPPPMSECMFSDTSPEKELPSTGPVLELSMNLQRSEQTTVVDSSENNTEFKENSEFNYVSDSVKVSEDDSKISSRNFIVSDETMPRPLKSRTESLVSRESSYSPFRPSPLNQSENLTFQEKPNNAVLNTSKFCVESISLNYPSISTDFESKDEIDSSILVENIPSWDRTCNSFSDNVVQSESKIKEVYKPEHTVSCDSDFGEFAVCDTEVSFQASCSISDEFNDFCQADDPEIASNVSFDKHVDISENVTSNIEQNIHSDDDDFGDFEAVNTNTPADSFVSSVHESDSTSTTSKQQIVQEVDDFADFEKERFDAGENFYESEENNFANFENVSIDQPSGSCQGDDTVQSSKELAKYENAVSGRVSKLIIASFPGPSPEETSEYEEASKSVDSDCTLLEQNSKSRRLWDKLQDLDETPALHFQWSVSHSFQKMLHSVNIDYHSILRMSSVPIFASGLSLLEPTKKPFGPAKLDLDEQPSKLHSPKEPIPPVHFDWSSSGLINPLDPVQATSTLMDLSFLATSENFSSKSTTSKELDLDELLGPSAELNCPDKTKSPPLIEKLMSLSSTTSVPQTRQRLRPADISEEANSVLDQLPDLSFMQAKVLMFPLRSNNN